MCRQKESIGKKEGRDARRLREKQDKHVVLKKRYRHVIECRKKYGLI